MKKTKLELFKQYLTENGCEVLNPTNEYEWCRFQIPNRPASVVYRNKDDFITKMLNDGAIVYSAFIDKNPFPIFEHKNKKCSKKWQRLGVLILRDGSQCFYCRNELQEEQMTLEHLIPRTAGGLNHIGNMVISCKPCNLKAGHKSVFEKIKIREASK